MTKMSQADYDAHIARLDQLEALLDVVYDALPAHSDAQEGLGKAYDAINEARVCLSISKGDYYKGMTAYGPG